MTRYPVPRDVDTPCTRNPDLHFSDSLAATEAAKHICSTCPFREPCADWAIRRGEHGVWGGMDDRQRSAYRRKHGIVAEQPRSLLPSSRKNTHVPHGTPVGVETHRRRYEPLCDTCSRFNATRRHGRKAS